jgi:hypothetical protein
MYHLPSTLLGGPVPGEARAVVGALDLIPLDRAVQDVACDAGDPALHALELLHPASAPPLADVLTAFVAHGG